MSNPFDLQHAVGVGADNGLNLAAMLEMVLRFAIAGVLGASIAYRPWRRLMADGPPPKPETAQAQTMIAVVGALMIAVIGDSMARAFGLVGLGAFIRFRSGIKDPRDAAVMFVMIGIGMACGLGHVPVAAIAAGFTGGVLALFDWTSRGRSRRTRAGIELEQPHTALSSIQAALTDARVVDMPRSNSAGIVVVEFGTSENADVASILAQLERHGVPGVMRVALRED